MKDNNKLSLFVLIFLAAAIGSLYWNTIYEMVMDWYNDENYSHGFLIPVISGYLLLQRKESIQEIAVKPSYVLGVITLVAGLSAFLIGELSGEYFVSRLSLLIVLAGVILFACGVRFFNAILFPFLYLILMIPLPYILYDSIAFPLKLLVSEVSVDFLESLGILVAREGNVIHLVDTTLEVADACSGIRSIISLLALSTALAYLTQSGLVKRVALSLLAVPVAIFVNSVRVIVTGILADKYGSQVAEGFFHEFAGFLIFSVAIVVLILSSILLNKIGKRKHE